MTKEFSKQTTAFTGLDSPLPCTVKSYQEEKHYNVTASNKKSDDTTTYTLTKI